MILVLPYRKRHVSPGSRNKAPAGKRKQKSKVVQEPEKEREEESDSGTSTPEPSARIAFPTGKGSNQDAASTRYNVYACDT